MYLKFHKINSFFSSEYANKDAIIFNKLSLLLYKTAYPTAKLLAKFSVKPNAVTWMSFSFALLAVLSLILLNKPFYYILFWLISIHLDFSDGTLARMTRNVSKSVFRLDHMTDLVKLFMVFISIGIFYNTFDTWVLVSSTIFFLMYSEILSHLAKFYFNHKNGSNIKLSGTKVSESDLFKSFLGNSPLLILFVRSANSIFFSISGHTLIFFCILPFGELYANCFLFYFSAICLFGLIRSIIVLCSLKR